MAFDSFQVLLFDQNINALLDHANLGLESVLQLCNDFGHQVTVVQLFTGLHDTHNSSLNLQLSVFFDDLVRVI